MNKSRSLRLALIVSTVMIFAVALMCVFVLGESAVTANAASYDLGNGYSLTSLTINGVSVDPSSWYSDYLAKGNGYPIYVFHPDDIVAEFEKNSAPVNAVCACFDLGTNENPTYDPSDPNPPIVGEDDGFHESNIYVKAWLHLRQR